MSTKKQTLKSLLGREGEREQVDLNLPDLQLRPTVTGNETFRPAQLRVEDYVPKDWERLSDALGAVREGVKDIRIGFEDMDQRKQIELTERFASNSPEEQKKLLKLQREQLAGKEKVLDNYFKNEYGLNPLNIIRANKLTGRLLISDYNVAKEDFIKEELDKLMLSKDEDGNFPVIPDDATLKQLTTDFARKFAIEKGLVEGSWGFKGFMEGTFESRVQDSNDMKSKFETFHQENVLIPRVAQNLRDLLLFSDAPTDQLGVEANEILKHLNGISGIEAKQKALQTIVETINPEEAEEVLTKLESIRDVLQIGNTKLGETKLFNSLEDNLYNTIQEHSQKLDKVSNDKAKEFLASVQTEAFKLFDADFNEENALSYIEKQEKVIFEQVDVGDKNSIGDLSDFDRIFIREQLDSLKSQIKGKAEYKLNQHETLVGADADGFRVEVSPDLISAITADTGLNLGEAVTFTDDAGLPDVRYDLAKEFSYLNGVFSREAIKYRNHYLDLYSAHRVRIREGMDEGKSIEMFSNSLDKYVTSVQKRLSKEVKERHDSNPNTILEKESDTWREQYNEKVENNKFIIQAEPVTFQGGGITGGVSTKKSTDPTQVTRQENITSISAKLEEIETNPYGYITKKLKEDSPENDYVIFTDIPNESKEDRQLRFNRLKEDSPDAIVVSKREADTLIENEKNNLTSVREASRRSDTLLKIPRNKVQHLVIDGDPVGTAFNMIQVRDATLEFYEEQGVQIDVADFNKNVIFPYVEIGLAHMNNHMEKVVNGLSIQDNADREIILYKTNPTLMENRNKLRGVLGYSINELDSMQMIIKSGQLNDDGFLRDAHGFLVKPEVINYETSIIRDIDYITPEGIDLYNKLNPEGKEPIQDTNKTFGALWKILPKVKGKQNQINLVRSFEAYTKLKDLCEICGWDVNEVIKTQNELRGNQKGVYQYQGTFGHELEYGKGKLFNGDLNGTIGPAKDFNGYNPVFWNELPDYQKSIIAIHREMEN